MLGKYTKEGGRLPELNCLPSVRQPGTPRVYFPNSPWLSGLQASADARRGQARDISSAASFPRPTGTPQATRRVLSADGRAGGDGGSEWPLHALSGSTRVTWFSPTGGCLDRKILASRLWHLSQWIHRAQQKWVCVWGTF